MKKELGIHKMIEYGKMIISGFVRRCGLSTNRNAVEPAESGVKSLGSAGFLFMEKGTVRRSGE